MDDSDGGSPASVNGPARPSRPDPGKTVLAVNGVIAAIGGTYAADTGPQALRTAAVIRLLLHNALRVDEACAADIADLGEDSGHRVLRVVRKGARKAKVPLTLATMAALEAYLADRAQRAGVADWRQLDGPLLATAAGGRLRQGHLWELVRRLARTAQIGAWDQLSPHSLRHSAITFALDAGATLRDVQDYAGHKDPRTTRRYDHSRDSLGRNAAYRRRLPGLTASRPCSSDHQYQGGGRCARRRPWLVSTGGSRPDAGAGPPPAPAGPQSRSLARRRSCLDVRPRGPPGWVDWRAGR